MNPMEVSNDVAGRMEAFLTAEEGEQPEEEQEQDGVTKEQAEPENESDDSQEESEDSEEGEDSESDFDTIEINGKNLQVPKEVATELGTLKKNLIADYTRKTQEAAEMRKQAHAFEEQARQRLEFERQNIDMVSKFQSAQERLKEYANVDWAALAEQDIALYSKHKEIRDGIRQEAHDIESELGRRQQFLAQHTAEQGKELVKKTVEIVQSVVPNYFEKYDTRVVDVANQLAAKIGIQLDQSALERVSRDPLAVLALVDLADYYDLKAKKPELSKKVAAAPKIGKSVQGKQRNQESQNARKRLRETGRDEYAAKLIENLL